MKSAIWNRPWVLGLAAVLAVSQSGSSAFGAWGSLRANNYGPHPAPAPHPAAPAVIAHQEHEINAVRRAEIDRAAQERRHLDIEEERRHSYFWFGFHPGMVLRGLPLGCLTLYVGPQPYFYQQGVYYQQTPAGFVVVAPPVGAVVPALPPGAETLAAGSVVYYYAGGAFYVPQPQGYLVVAPPPGITVSYLPPGAAPVFINGVQYYQANGAYFLPVMEGGVTVYTTVAP